MTKKDKPLMWLMVVIFLLLSLIMLQQWTIKEQYNLKRESYLENENLCETKLDEVYRGIKLECSSWRIHWVSEEGITCDNFDYRLLARRTVNQTICKEAGLEINDNKEWCSIGMLYVLSINKQFCNFQKGDLIWLRD